jgi:NAD(P)-dependent dehydrogenase (short-subunit alcohol dehydrogenase family)
MLLRDKVIVVSGIGPGLGVKLALHAAREGARAVVLAGRTRANLDEAAQRVAAEGTGCGILAEQNDIRDAAQCRRLAETTVARFGGVDALLNNAYAHPDSDLIQSSDFHGWPAAFETNVIGTLKMTQAYLPHMKARGGAVVMINTIGAKMTPGPGEGSYCASKAALVSATRTLASEVGQYQIRVNGIHMGFMWGQPLQSYARAQWGSKEAGLAVLSATHPMKRLATDDECARAALFLASDYSSAMTGTSIDCNAGIYMP